MDYTTELVRQLKPSIIQECGTGTTLESPLSSTQAMIAKIGRPKMPKKMLRTIASIIDVEAEKQRHHRVGTTPIIDRELFVHIVRQRKALT